MAIQYKDLITSDSKNFLDSDGKQVRVRGDASVTTFDIVFYTYSGADIVVDKTSGLTTDFTISGVLKERTSIVNPSILIYRTEFITSNYCYIASFNRYYYIANITSESKNAWRIDLKCDVLMTYKSDINSSNGYVERTASETYANHEIIDPMRIDVQRFVKKQEDGVAQTGTGLSTWYSSDEMLSSSTTQKLYNLIMQGASSGFSGQNNLCANQTNMASLINGMNQTVQLNTAVQGKTIPDYIIEEYATPYEPSFDSYPLTSIYLPKSIFTDVSYSIPSGVNIYYRKVSERKMFKWKIVISQEYNQPYELYKNRHILQFQPFGQIDIDPTCLRYHIPTGESHYIIECFVMVIVDTLSNDAFLYISPNDSKYILIGTRTIKMPIPFNREGIDVKGLASSVTGLTMSMGLASMGYPVEMSAMLSQGMNAVRSIGVRNSSVSSGTAFIIDKQPSLITTIQAETILPTNYLGFPCYTSLTLSSGLGFTKCIDVRLVGIDGTLQEIDEIKNLLKSGVIL